MAAIGTAWFLAVSAQGKRIDALENTFSRLNGELTRMIEQLGRLNEVESRITASIRGELGQLRAELGGKVDTVNESIRAELRGLRETLDERSKGLEGRVEAAARTLEHRIGFIEKVVDRTDARLSTMGSPRDVVGQAPAEADESDAEQPAEEAPPTTTA